jgi:molybdopterin-synthase adenylyltransferase
MFARFAAGFRRHAVDRDGARAILNEFCLAYELPYFDLASDIVHGPASEFGGRVCAVVGGKRCLMCLDVLDANEVSLDFATGAQRRDRDAIYGVRPEALDQGGPSVVSINGAVASLAVTEFMAFAVGLREPRGLLNYYGRRGIVTTAAREPEAGCYYCTTVRGQLERAEVERYLAEGVVQNLK